MCRPPRPRGRTAAIAGFLLAAVGALTLLAALAGIGNAQAPPRTYYVSLGDSLARGWQPAPDGRTRMTNRGYVDTVAAYLARTESNLLSVKYGCGGETTGTMMRGGICTYPRGSELAQAEQFLRAHRGQIAAVSVNIGDNDVERCLAGGSVNTTCVNNAMAGIKTRLPAIAQGLSAAAGPGVKLVGMTDYDQFLAYWLQGAGGRAFARQSVSVVTDLNHTADGIYSGAGFRVADAAGAFATKDLTDRDPLPGHGRQPRAVARVCSWTWACSSPPIGFNDHANDAGYRMLGRVVINALRR